jgi:hypothetical protein
MCPALGKVEPSPTVRSSSIAVRETPDGSSGRSVHSAHRQVRASGTRRCEARQLCTFVSAMSGRSNSQTLCGADPD